MFVHAILDWYIFYECMCNFLFWMARLCAIPFSISTISASIHVYAVAFVFVFSNEPLPICSLCIHMPGCVCAFKRVEVFPACKLAVKQACMNTSLIQSNPFVAFALRPIHQANQLESNGLFLCKPFCGGGCVKLFSKCFYNVKLYINIFLDCKYMVIIGTMLVAKWNGINARQIEAGWIVGATNGSALLVVGWRMVGSAIFHSICCVQWQPVFIGNRRRWQIKSHGDIHHSVMQ